MPHTRTLAVLVVLSLLVATIPVAALGGVDRSGSSDAPVAAATAATHSALDRSANESNASVNVTVGQQLSTVLRTTSDDVQTEVENTAFEVRFEAANESERAELIDERADELRERAEEIREDYEEATDAFRAGDLTRSEYAQRLATLNARAANVLTSSEILQQRAANLSALELRAAGVNRTALREAINDLDSVTGLGPSALLKRFIGETRGEIELETKGGLSIEVEREDGEQSREINRDPDEETNITISQADALETARAVLSNVTGQWVLQKSSINHQQGYYTFEFTLTSNTTTGEAEVLVDGSSSEIVTLEEEIEPREEEEEEEEEGGEGEADDDEKDEENETEEGGELALIVANGTPEPNGTVTVQVLAAGQPVENATVMLNDEVIGTTGSDGTLTLTLPAQKAKITAEKGDREAELEFEFEEDEDEEFFEDFQVAASLADGTVTVTVTFNGSGVANATVYANDRTVGTTSADGTVSFDVGTDTEELEIEVVKGEFEAELAYTIQNGSLTRSEDTHEGDGDKVEDEEETEAGEDEEGEDEEETETPTEDDGDDSDEEDDGEGGEEENGDEEETETPPPEDEEGEDGDDTEETGTETPTEDGDDDTDTDDSEGEDGDGDGEETETPTEEDGDTDDSEDEDEDEETETEEDGG